MKKLSFTVVSILYMAHLFAQAPGWAWTKSIGGNGNDVPLSLKCDLQGNIYSCGSFQGTVDFDPGAGIFNLTSVGDYDIFILKLDSGGHLCWAKAMGGTAFDRCFSLALDASGNVYSAGQFSGTADMDPGPGVFNLTGGGSFISKLDSSGNFIWAKAITGSGGYSITLDAALNIYAAGYFSETTDFDPGAGIFNLNATGSTDIFILKLDSSGNFIWARAMGGGGGDVAWTITIDTLGNGDVYTTGIFMDTVDFDPGPGTFDIISGGNSSVFISKLSSAGDFIWAKAIGGAPLNFSGGLSLAVSQTGNGSVYTTGFFSGVNDFDPGIGVYNLTSAGTNDIFISKLDSSGSFIWAQQLGGTHNDVALALTLDASDNIYTSGFFNDTADFDPGVAVFNLFSAGDRDIFVSKLDSAGNFISARSVGGLLEDDGRSITLDPNNNIVVAGDFASPVISFDTSALVNSGNGTSDSFIAKLNTELITALENPGNSNGDISLFPNPAGAEVTIRFAKEVLGTIQLINVMGKVLVQEQIQSSICKINIGDMPGGIYFIHITDHNGHKIPTKKIIKLYH